MSVRGATSVRTRTSTGAAGGTGPGTTRAPARTWWSWLPGLRPAPEPEAELEVAATTSGAVVRVVAGVVVAVMLGLGWSVLLPLTWTAAVVWLLVAAAVVLLPRAGLVGFAVGAVGLAVLVAGSPTVATTLLLVLLVHLAVWASAWTARVGPRARVELAVLADSLREVALVQVPAQVLAVAALALAGAQLDLGDVVRVLTLVAGAAVAALVLPRRS